MPKRSVYSAKQIDTICEEIERQWRCHLFVRAAFPSGLKFQSGDKGYIEWSSPRFYRQRGVQFSVRLEISPDMNDELDSIGHWLNQNYIVRLFGILDEHRVIKAGKNVNNKLTGILAGLRHRVGAHSSGYMNQHSKDVRKLRRWIQEELDPNMDDTDVRRFNLSIDKVLYGLKRGCTEFVRTLEHNDIP